jgi:hypothetical protein
VVPQARPARFGWGAGAWGGELLLTGGAMLGVVWLRPSSRVPFGGVAWARSGRVRESVCLSAYPYPYFCSYPYP